MPLCAARERLAAAEEVGALAFAERRHDGDQRIAGGAVGVEVVALHQVEERVERRAGAHLGAQLDDGGEPPPRRLGQQLAGGGDGGGALRREQGDRAPPHWLVLGVDQRQHRRHRRRRLHLLEVGEGEVAHQDVGAGHRRRRRAGDAFLVDAELRQHDQRRAARLDIGAFDQSDESFQGGVHRGRVSGGERREARET